MDKVLISLVAIGLVWSVLLSAGELLPADEHAIAIWDFQSVSGGKIPDKSGFGNDAIPSVMEDGQKPGVINDGLLFDGIGGYLQIEKKESLNVAKGDFSIEIVFKIGEVKSQGKIIDMIFIGNKSQSAKDGGFYLSYLVWQDKSIIFNHCEKGEPIDFSAPLDSTLLPGQWHYMAVTFEKGTLKIWMDGTPIAEKRDIPSINLSSELPFRIGIYPVPWQRDSDGKLKDKRSFEGTMKAIRISDMARDVSSIYKNIAGELNQ